MRPRRIRMIHVARRQLALTDDAYRSLLTGATGRRSLRDMTEDELEQVITALEDAGFIRFRLRGQWGVMYRHWAALHAAGAVRSRSLAALRTWVKRQAGEQDIYSRGQLARMIESLKRWRARIAG